MPPAYTPHAPPVTPVIHSFSPTGVTATTATPPPSATTIVFVPRTLHLSNVPSKFSSFRSAQPPTDSPPPAYDDVVKEVQAIGTPV